MAASATVIEHCNFRDKTDLHSLSNSPNELTFAIIWADNSSDCTDYVFDAVIQL